MSTTYEPTHIIVLTNGFVFAGNMSADDTYLTITNPYNIRIWGTEGKGLGWLALYGPTPATKLDACTTVRAPLSQLVFTLQVESGPWSIK